MVEEGWDDLFPGALPLDAYLRYEVTVTNAVDFANAMGVSADSEVEATQTESSAGRVWARIAEYWQTSSNLPTRPVPREARAILEDMPIATIAALSFLFWPRAVAEKTHIRLVDFAGDNFDYWLAQFDGDSSRAEQMVNHIHLWDWFEGDDSSLPALEGVGDAIARAWRKKVSAEFPNVEYIVEVGEGAYGPELTIFRPSG